MALTCWKVHKREINVDALSKCTSFFEGSLNKDDLLKSELSIPLALPGGKD